ncbi:MAG: nitrogen regulation protein NR(II) [Pseudobdellovibrionaceae bacterium]
MTQSATNHLRFTPAQLLGATRLGVFSVILIILILDQVLQKNFLNVGLIFPAYTILAIAFVAHFLWFVAKKKFETASTTLVLLVDVVLISGLIYFSGTGQILFSFLYLVHILLAGLLLGSRGAQIVALTSALCFTVVMILGDEIKGPSFLFLLAINNGAFFVIAGLSSYLSEQLNFMSEAVKLQVLQLKDLRNLNEVILREMPVGVLSFTSKDEVISVNPVLGRLFGSDRLSPSDFSIENQTQDLKEGQSTEIFEVQKKWQDENKNLLVKVSKMREPQTKMPLFIASIQDVTNYKKLEASVRQSEKLAAIGTLAAGIAHEIRNPLAGISGSIQMMNESSKNDEDKKLMSIVLKEIDRLNGLVSDFLDYAKPEREPTEPVDLKGILDECFYLISMNDKLSRKVVQKVDLPSSLPVKGDKDRLKQVFLNILLNAYQAMEKSEIQVLKVQGRVDQRTVEIQIEDSGGGMSEKTKQKLFEPFYTTKSKGTGLGLALTHKILEGHSARIFVESEEGKGSKFKVEFPAFH